MALIAPRPRPLTLTIRLATPRRTNRMDTTIISLLIALVFFTGTLFGLAVSLSIQWLHTKGFFDQATQQQIDFQRERLNTLTEWMEEINQRIPPQSE